MLNFVSVPVGGTRKVKPIWILLKQETVSGSGISWAICKSASRSRQITMPVPHHSKFFTGGCFFCRPTNNIEALKANIIRDYMYFYRPSFIRIGKGLWAWEPLKHYKLSQNIDILAGFCPSRATAKTNPDKIWCRCIACTICLLHCAKFG